MAKSTPLDLHATLVNAARTYEFELDGQRCLYTVAVSAEWPREIGNADLAALADTLGRAAFGRHGDMPVADAVTAFLADTAGVLPGPGKVTHDFTAPELASGHWTLTTDISRTALTPRVCDLYGDIFIVYGWRASQHCRHSTHLRSCRRSAGHHGLSVQAGE